MKRKTVYFILITVMCVLGVIVGLIIMKANRKADGIIQNQQHTTASSAINSGISNDHTQIDGTEIASIATKIEKAHSDCIEIRTHDVVLQTETEGTVEITVQMPDYEALYKEAYASIDPSDYLLTALASGKYDTCERTITARVTIEEGIQIIHTEEAVRALLEQEFSNAINTLLGDN